MPGDPNSLKVETTKSRTRKSLGSITSSLSELLALGVCYRASSAGTMGPGMVGKPVRRET